MTHTRATPDLRVGDFTSRDAVPRIYGEALVELAREDPRIVCLGADLSPATETDLFRDTLPERFHNLGIAEANMIGVAGGMARMGDVPFAHTFAVFATRRSYDQIAMQVAYPRTNVKIVGFLPGLTTALGVSHQAIDDLALMRALPNMTVVEPAGPEQVRAAVRAAAAHDGPLYLRMRRLQGTFPEPFQVQPFEIGPARVVREGSDGVVFACGMLVRTAVDAAGILAQRKLKIAVIDVATVKPLDVPAIIEWSVRTGCVVSAENHSIIGGLGSAVSEALTEAGVGVRFARVGVQDTFAEGGSTPYLFRKYGLNAATIVAAFERLRRTDA